MSLAARKRAQILAARLASSTAPDRAATVGRAGLVPARSADTPAGADLAPAPAAAPTGPAPASPARAPSSPATQLAAQMALRFTHDIRRLKEIRSTDGKVAAKREMLPAYADWVKGLLDAGAGAMPGIAGEILPTCMVWLIDVGAYEDALVLAEFVLRHRIPLPARYQRDAPSVIVEEIANKALKAQGANEAFPLDVLDQVEAMTAGLDLHDEIRAKLCKAIGVERLDRAEDMPAEESRDALAATLATLKEAARLNPRVGVKDRVKRVEKLLAAIDQAAAAPDQVETPAGAGVVASAPATPAKARAPRAPRAKAAPKKSAGKPAGASPRPRR